MLRMDKNISVKQKRIRVFEVLREVPNTELNRFLLTDY